MRKDFDLLLQIVTEEFADTLQIPVKDTEKFLLDLYKEALKNK